MKPITMDKAKDVIIVDELSSETLEKMVEKGGRFLERLEFREAEVLFSEVLKIISSKKPSLSSSGLVAESLLGLGEVYHRLSRHEEHHLTEWLRMMFQSLLMYSEATEISRRNVDDLQNKLKEFHAASENVHSRIGRRNLIVKAQDTGKYDFSFFRQIESRADIQINHIEKCLVNELKANVIKHCLTSKTVCEDLPGTCVLWETAGLLAGTMKKREHGLPGTLMPEPGFIYPSVTNQYDFDGAWLYEILTRCIDHKTEHPDKTLSDEYKIEFDSPSDNSSQSSVVQHETESDLQSFLAQQTKCKINFPMLQDAIRRLVNQVSSDVWSKYDGTVRRIPRELIERRLASEIILRLSPGSEDNKTLTEALEEAILFENESECLEFQSITDRSINSSSDSSGLNSDFNTELNSEINHQMYENDSVFYASDSDDESNYETFVVEIDPCAAHTSEKLTHEDCVQSSAGKCVTYYQNRGCKNIESPNKDSRMDQQIALKERDAKISDCLASDVARYSLSPQRKNASRISSNDMDKNRSVNSASGNQQTRFIKTQQNGNHARHTEESTTEKVYMNINDTGREADSFGSRLNGILRIWKASGEEKSDVESRRPHLLDTIEELSALTEKDRSLEFIEAEKDLEFDVERGENKFLNETNLRQTVARIAVRVAEAMDADGMTAAACEIFKYALDIFLKFSPQECESRRAVISDVIQSIGKVKCKLGDTCSGLQLLDESVALYEGKMSPTIPLDTATQRRDMYKISQMHYQQGNSLLPESYRQDLLISHIMSLAKQATLDEDPDDHCDADSSDDDYTREEEDNSDDEDNYSVCCIEAIECYKKSLTCLERLRGKTQDDQKIPSLLAQLFIDVLSTLADCYVICDHLESALQLYERTLQLFERSLGGDSTVLAKNSHVLSMIGTLNFLTRNWVRAATMYETSHILMQHLKGIPDNPTLEMPWTLCMLSLSYFMLGHYHKCVVWSIRSFTLYVRLYRGRIMDVDSLGHWFIVQTLYMLGFAYATIRLNDKALSYLTLCKNMAVRSSRGHEDKHQVISVLIVLADTYRALDDNDNASKYYNQALEHSKTMGDNTTTSSISNIMLSRQNCFNKKPAGKDDQKCLEKLIKEDTVRQLHKLGVDSSISTWDAEGETDGDCNYTKALETCHLETDISGKDIRASLTNTVINESIQQDVIYFEEIIERPLSIATPVSLQYVAYKYQQANSAQVR